MTAKTSASLNFSACPHRHVVDASRGGCHFSAGEFWDDIEELWLCLDCMEYLSEADMHPSRNGGKHVKAADPREEDDDVPF